MVSSRFIHTVVRLCLVIAVVVQPIAISAAPARCSASRVSQGSADQRCNGCGHCKVTSDEELCGCCSGGQSDEAVQGCCGAQASKSEVASRQADPVFGELSELVPEPYAEAEHSKAVAAVGQRDVSVVTSLCMCGVHSQPATPVVPRAPLGEDVEARPLALDGIVLGASVSSVSRSRFYESPDARMLFTLDALRHLCVWRL